MKHKTEYKIRCFGNKPDQKFYADYHDYEWGIPVYDDKILFEMLILEGAQAGLSWTTILKKRDGYRLAFHQFNIQKVSSMTDAELDALTLNTDIIRNRLKIYSTRNNAIVFLNIQKEFGSFSKYLWQYVNNKPIINDWHYPKQIPVTTTISDAISKDLNKRGMSFVGSKIIYAYMQAVGLVNDHIRGCWCYKRNR